MDAQAPVTLSVVLPVYRVQAYLRDCLDSILAQGRDDIEVIAVDDCSPDHCGAILDEYAERDPRVQVRHLRENVGLGEARNIGLESATGRYVWFVDSDDWLAEGALPAILDRLERTRPDVLIFDYARVRWDGRTVRNGLNYLFREPPAPEVFTAKQRPSVIQLMMTAWNKAIRREFLRDLGLRFSRGYYEDLNVTYPILLAAQKISLLDRVCYFYRQRRLGAITKTAGDKHFDAFAQYEKVFAFVESSHDRLDDFGSIMFDRVFWHLLIVMGQRRVPRARRREFFHRMSRLYAEHRPPGHTYPSGTAGIKHRLIERDAYLLFGILRAFNLGRAASRGRLRRGRRIVRAFARLAYRRTKQLYYRIQLRLPLMDDLAVYAAYWYRGYACNPGAIYEKARELAPSVRGVWVVRKEMVATMPAGVEYVIAGSWAYWRAVARAKYLVNNVNFPDHISRRKGSVHLQTQHGTPLKTMGVDLIKYPVAAKDMDFDRLLARSDRWDFLISSNPLSSEVWERVFPCPYELLEIGYPRNDQLASATSEQIAQTRRALGITEDKTVILYAPTFRDYWDRFRVPLDIGRLATALGPNHLILVRAHYLFSVDDLVVERAWPANRVIDVSRHPRVEELCLASDVLITDYSSIMFDYAILDRPIVIYADDWDTYRRTRGVYFDLLEHPPGAVATTEDELIQLFTTEMVRDDAATKARAEFRRLHCCWDDGRAAERAVRRVILGQPVGPR